MKFLLFLFITILFFPSCEDNPNEIIGVWYTVENHMGMPYYFESHITDTSFTVINQDGLTFIASYKVKPDTLKQYVKSMQEPFQIVDTINFRIEIFKDSFSLVNFSNYEKSTSWKKLDKVKPTDLLYIKGIREFSDQFRERFIYNYLNKTNNLNKEVLLKNFDDRWNIEN